MSILEFDPKRATNHLVDNFKGALLGLQVGDALGMPVQGWLHQDIKDNYAVLDYMTRGMLDRGEYTEDTESTFAVAHALWKTRGFNGTVVAKSLLYHYNKRRGYELTTVKAFNALHSGFSWLESGLSTFYSHRSYGNGAAARAVPLALIYADEPEKLTEYTVLSSRITHVHPYAIEGAKLIAYAIAHLLHNVKTGKTLDPLMFCEYLETKLEEKLYKDKFLVLKKFLRSKPAPKQVIAELGCDHESIHSVPTALYCFLAHCEDFFSAVRFAVNLGGDTDTLGALTGALAGAYLGAKGIPHEWRHDLKDRGKHASALGIRMWHLWNDQDILRRGKMSARLSRM